MEAHIFPGLISAGSQSDFMQLKENKSLELVCAEYFTGNGDFTCEFTPLACFQGRMKVFVYPCMHLRQGVNMLILTSSGERQSNHCVDSYAQLGETHPACCVCNQ